MKKLKVFHGVLNYGTQAGLFAQALRNLEVDAISATIKDKYNRKTDVILYKGNNLFASLINNIFDTFKSIYFIFRYNTFHFYFGRSMFPFQLDLPLYRILGKKVIMEHMGNDIRKYRLLINKYNLPPEHRFCMNVEEHDKKILKRIVFEGRYINYRLVCLPNHLDFVDADEVIPLSLNLSEIKYCPKDVGETIYIMHAPTDKLLKGTDYIIDAVKKLNLNGYKVTLNLIENVTHDQIIEEYKKCDIFIDQISTGWYGTSALEAMATGRTTCAYFDEGYFKYIDYYKEIPVINTNRENVYEKLKKLLENKEELNIIGARSRKFIEDYHDVDKVVKRLLKIYKEKVWKI